MPLDTVTRATQCSPSRVMLPSPDPRRCLATSATFLCCSPGAPSPLLDGPSLPNATGRELRDRPRKVLPVGQLVDPLGGDAEVGSNLCNAHEVMHGPRVFLGDHQEANPTVARAGQSFAFDTGSISSWTNRSSSRAGIRRLAPIRPERSCPVPINSKTFVRLTLRTAAASSGVNRSRSGGEERRSTRRRPPSAACPSPVTVIRLGDRSIVVVWSLAGIDRPRCSSLLTGVSSHKRVHLLFCSRGHRFVT